MICSTEGRYAGTMIAMKIDAEMSNAHAMRRKIMLSCCGRCVERDMRFAEPSRGSIGLDCVELDRMC